MLYLGARVARNMNKNNGRGDIVINTQRRRRTVRLTLLVALGVLSAWIMPSVLATTATVVNAVGEQSQSFGLLIISPAGWAVSMLIGFLVLLRAGALRRR